MEGIQMALEHGGVRAAAGMSCWKNQGKTQPSAPRWSVKIIWECPSEHEQRGVQGKLLDADQRPQYRQRPRRQC